MNNYEEALEEVLENGGYLDGGKADYKAPRVLHEAISKAEKYDDMKAENKVLKDGVKAIFNDYAFDSVWKSYSTGHTINFHSMRNEEKLKIKAMLEVVENE